MDSLQSRPSTGFVSSLPARGGAFQSMRSSGGGFSGGLIARTIVAPSVAPSAAPVSATQSAAATPAVETSAAAAPIEAPAPDPTAELEAEMIRREQTRAAEHKMAMAELEAERKKMHEATNRLGQLAAELARLRSTLISEMRAEAGEILLNGARRLAHESLAADESLLAAMAIDAAAALGGDERVVRVNPEDVPRLEGKLGEGFSVVGDAKVQAGCVVEGHGGSIDATVEAAAAALRADTENWRRAG